MYSGHCKVKHSKPNGAHVSWKLLSKGLENLIYFPYKSALNIPTIVYLSELRQ